MGETMSALPQSEVIRPGYEAYLARDDLVKYEQNALLLFAAQLKLDFDDVDSFASNWLTDNNNDKKCDMVALSDSREVLVVAQAYVTERDRESAPANKASDLNTAVTWMLDGPLDTMPETLRSAAQEARDAIESGDVRELQLWYVHNLPESANVESELRQAANTADSLINRHFPDAQIDVSFLEIGRETLEEEFRQTQEPILVADKLIFHVPGGFTIKGDTWDAYSTAISAGQLRELWQKYQTKLMSPNIRDYLGIVKNKGNINNGIKETAKSQPGNFAIYNNGITVLVNDYSITDVKDGGELLHVTGIGIVNGGQTTGAVGGLEDVDAGNLDSARVMARFVKCSDTEVLGNIVRFNNTQNKVEATDFRSGTPVQERLRSEFKIVPDAEYRGGRRGGSSDAIERRRALLPDSTVAQSLAAFHGDPNLAYNDTRRIWEDDAIYASLFRETVSARHIVFAYSLLKAVENAKQAIVKLPESDRTDAQKRHATFFSARGSNYLLVAAVGACIETIVGKAVADRYSLRFKENLSPTRATEKWQPVVDTLVAFTSTTLHDATNQGLKSRDRVAKAVESFSAMVEATRAANPAPMNALAESLA